MSRRGDTDMNEQGIIEKTEMYVRKSLSKDSTGHDWWHAKRVRDLALYIASQEGGDLFLIELSALLHDIADWKFHQCDEEAGPRVIRAWLESLQVEEETIVLICNIVKGITFRGANITNPMLCKEGEIIQDADRLDAIGAIGIARAFAFGGYKGCPIYNPEEEPRTYATFEEYQANTSSTIHHFDEKLLLLKDRMNTKTAREIAKTRHDFMEDFLSRFQDEWFYFQKSHF